MIKRTIDTISKRFGFDAHYLVSGGFWLTVAKIVSALTSIATSLVFANYLPEETYGTFRYALSFFVIFSVFSLSGIDTSLIKAITKGFSATTRLAFFTKLRFGLIGSILGFAIAIYYFIQNNVELGIIFILGSILAPLMESTYIYVSHLNGKKDFLRTSSYVSITRVVSAVSLIITVLITKNVIYIILIYLLSNLLLRILFLKFTINKYPWSGEVDHQSINFGKHLTITYGATQIVGNLDKLIVFIFVGPATLAGYYLAMVPFKQIKNILSSIDSLALPKFANKDSSELKKILPKIIIFFWCVIIPVIIAYWLLADLIFANLLPLYTEYAMLSKIFILLLLLYPIDLLQTALTALSAKKEIYQITITTSVVRAVLLLIAIPLYGMWGAVAVILFTHTLNASLKIIVFIRHAKSVSNISTH